MKISKFFVHHGVKFAPKKPPLVLLRKGKKIKGPKFITFITMKLIVTKVCLFNLNQTLGKMVEK